jgi:hypothetical protein
MAALLFAPVQRTAAKEMSPLIIDGHQNGNPVSFSKWSRRQRVALFGKANTSSPEQRRID